MRYTDTSSIIIYSGKIANELLRRGHRIVKVMPDRRNKIKTVFIFANDECIVQDVDELTRPNDSEIFAQIKSRDVMFRYSLYHCGKIRRKYNHKIVE